MNMKKLTALFSAFTVALSAVATGAAAVSAEGDTAESTAKTVQFSQAETLFDCDYSDGVLDNNDRKAFTNYYCETWPAVESEGNTAMYFCKSWTGETFLYLGADYKLKDKNQIKAQSISVKEGETYTIKFKYKIVIDNQNDCQGGFNFGVCTTMPNDHVGMAADHSNVSEYNYIYDNKNAILSGKQTAGTDGWVEKTVTYTVGEIKSLSDGTLCDKLVIYWCTGNGMTGWVDDVTVTKNAVYSGVQVANNDYQDVALATTSWNHWYTAYNNEVRPDVDPDDSGNMLMRCYRLNAYYSYLYLGAGYRKPDSRNTVASETISVEEGETYAIRFKYKLSNMDSTKSNSFEVGICTTVPATSSFYSDSSKNPDDLTYEDPWANNKYQNGKKAILTSSAEATDGWVEYSSVYTVGAIENTPANAKVPNIPINQLAVYINYCDSRAVYIDDVTVIKITSETAVSASDAVISETDFSNTTAKSDFWTAKMGDSCGDCYPVTDPKNENGIAVYYDGGTSNTGIIFAGAPMTNNNANKAAALTAKAGAAYRVTFSYYATEKAPDNAPFEIGVRVRNATKCNCYNTGEEDESGNKIWDGETCNRYSYQKTLVSYPAETKFDMTGYETVTATFVIPADTDFSTYGDKLGLYLKGNNGPKAYINYLKFEELAPSTVMFETGNGFESAVFYTGDTAAYSAAEGKTMLWYSDKDKTKSVRLADLEVGGKIKTETVYGTAVENGAPIIIGDTDMDGEFSAEDIAQMRKILIDETEMKSEYRTDVNTDGAVDIRDLVRIKKISASGAKKLSEFKLVNETGEYASIKANYEKLEALVTGGETATKTVTVKFDDKLGENEYLVRPDNSGNIVVAGGSETAVNAAILSLIGHINTGREITNDYFICAEISGGATPAAVSYYFSEDFDTDITGKIDQGVYDADWSQTYYGNGTAKYILSNTTTKVENGSLVLYGAETTEDFKNPDGDTNEYDYACAEIKTEEFYSYGYFEIKAKVNASTGICPAFWLCGSTDYMDETDKTSYEVDIFECFGGYPNYLKGTLLAHDYSKGESSYTAHGFKIYRLSGADAYACPGGKTPLAVKQSNGTYTLGWNDNTDPSYNYNAAGWGDEWHTFGLDWRETGFTWYIDGVAVMKADMPSTGYLNAANPNKEYKFDQKMRVRLSCYAGNNVASLTSTPDDTTDWENGSSLVVDWLRVIQY